MAARPPASGPVRGARQLAPAGPVSGLAGGAPVGAGEPRPVLDHPDRYSAGGALGAPGPLSLSQASQLSCRGGGDRRPAPGLRGLGDRPGLFPAQLGSPDSAHPRRGRGVGAAAGLKPISAAILADPTHAAGHLAKRWSRRRPGAETQGTRRAGSEGRYKVCLAVSRRCLLNLSRLFRLAMIQPIPIGFETDLLGRCASDYIQAGSMKGPLQNGR